MYTSILLFLFLVFSEFRSTVNRASKVPRQGYLKLIMVIQTVGIILKHKPPFSNYITKDKISASKFNITKHQYYIIRKPI